MRISGDGKITWENASASSKYLLEMRVAGDSYPRFRIRADGQIEWGSGSAVTDVTLQRATGNILKLSNYFRTSEKSIGAINMSSGSTCFIVQQSGDTYNRFDILGSGTIRMGSGSSTPDCILQRRAADIFNTPDRLEVGTLGVGNSAAGSTLGNVVKKVEIFDDAGNSLGFLAVYDSIT